MAFVTLVHDPSGSEFAAIIDDTGTVTAIAVPTIGELAEPDRDRAAALCGDYTYDGDIEAIEQAQRWLDEGRYRVRREA